VTARASADKGVSVVDASGWSAERWDELAVRSPNGHAFQSHAWGELKRPLGWGIHRFMVESAGRPTAAVQLQVRPILPRLPAFLRARTYLYAPRGPILLGQGPEAARAALAGLREIAGRLAAAIVTVDPQWPIGGPLAGELAAAGFGPAARDVQVSRTAMLVPLHAEEEAQHRLVRKSTANLVNRARRAGATVERVDLVGGAGGPGMGDEALAGMWDLLSATARREGIVLRDREYQVDQWRALGAAGLAWLWFAGAGGPRWVGSVLLCCGSTLHQFQAGSSDDADLRAVPANHLLQWEIIRWAAAEGFRWYDLGGVDTPTARGLPADEGHPLWNLYVFKRGFGAEGVEYVRANERAANPLVRLAWTVARGSS
jgi:lipid II:glycine glycyltransferase (peptidoglycan interpeptide bridge formation enzyme)